MHRSQLSGCVIGVLMSAICVVAVASEDAEQPVRFIVAGNGQPHITIVNEHGAQLWSHQVAGKVYCAQALANGNLLFADYGIRQVQEMKTSGEVVWRTDKIKLQPSALDVSRLTNGNTLICQQGSVIEVNQEQEVVWRYTCNTTPWGALRIDGKRTLIAMWSENRVIEITLMDEVVREIGQLSVPHDVVLLESGNWLISDMGNDRVIEIDRDGQIVWEHKCKGGPGSACRLPDGRTVVSDWSDGVYLVDQEGQMMRKLFTQHNPGKVRIVPAEFAIPTD